MYRIIFLIFLLLSSKCIQSAEVSDLYQFKVLVSDKSTYSRDQASKAALLGVLTKVSGSTVDSELPEIKDAFNNISQFMRKYQYQDAEYGEQYLIIRFDNNKVDSLLNETGYPIWGNRRPLVLIWLAFEDAFQRDLVTREGFPQIEQVLSDQSQKRALPIVLPLLDLEDRVNITVSDVWANFSEPVNLASKRYNPERIVTARLYKPHQQTSWHLDWRFTHDSELAIESIIGDQQQVISQMIDDISSALAGRYGVNKSQENNQRGELFMLSGVDSYIELEHAKRRLLTLNVVQDIKIESIADSKVTLKLILNGSTQDLANTLSLDKGFKRIFDPFAPVDENTIEHYQWLGLR